MLFLPQRQPFPFPNAQSYDIVRSTDALSRTPHHATRRNALHTIYMANRISCILCQICLLSLFIHSSYYCFYVQRQSSLPPRMSYGSSSESGGIAVKENAPLWQFGWTLHFGLHIVRYRQQSCANQSYLCVIYSAQHFNAPLETEDR
jgi:hypothetical protein